ncbi:hypothetical protein WN51_12910 [Melipona quadrifasciata]|uniref:FERM domain-containing protein n=1 Tax=Melipona quadrifasciata TaxID=166423 RepID=A0A0M9AAA8_9HYME|nr:hypothetical protein WN51_12910 [Melipona quadrifasciata]
MPNQLQQTVRRQNERKQLLQVLGLTSSRERLKVKPCDSMARRNIQQVSRASTYGVDIYMM